MFHPHNPMEQSSSREAKRFSATQETPEMLRNPTVYCHVRKSPPLVLIVSQINRLKLKRLKHRSNRQQCYCRVVFCYAGGCVFLLIIQHCMTLRNVIMFQPPFGSVQGSLHLL
jgi:hypothetical protein